ncbi:MAG: IS4 family transposase [gamma proteobacterium symbiont of Bathyaustriella thionipta]|nr:IS4 family transposase [gamma proteobacterium symbiont of Bathyaustriella thionipta]
MKAIKLLHKNLSTACPDMHEMRLKALMAGVSSALTEHQVTVTGLGRNLKSYSKTKTKHDIKRMDRLIGNKHLLAERKDIYQYLTKHLVGVQKHPILIADWSPIPGNEIFQLLRISIPMGGRALTIYEACFVEKKLNNTQVHDIFLDELEAILPEGCQPIILSDAIFKTPWFKTIESKGWYWVGRVRGNVRLSMDGETFESCASIMKQATRKVMALGTVLYSKKTQFPCLGVMYHGTEKGKHKKKKRGGISQDTKSLYYSKKAKQPWLLVSHLPEKLNAPKKVIQLYRYRMQIEENFRDTKNQQYGIGLAQAKSRSSKRYNNLLLLAALTQFLLWCIGKVAVDKKYHYHLQANTTRHKAVLSNIYIAIQIVNDKRYQIKKKELRRALEQVSQFTKTIVDVA